MRQKLYVLLGDVVSSRRIDDRDMFQRKLEEAYKKVNNTYSEDIYANFKILKGIDDIGGVLLTMSNCFNIIDSILEQLYPNLMRFVLVLDYIDVGLDTKNVIRMDGPAFHKASDLINSLKKSKLLFDMSVKDKIIDNAIAGQINLILLLKKKWSRKQYQIVREYKKVKNQQEVAMKLGISQQAVSKTLNRSMWKEIKHIEKNLNYIFSAYQTRCADGEKR